MVPKSLAKWTRGSAKAKQKGNLDRRPLYTKGALGNLSLGLQFGMAGGKLRSEV
jgi:hypothetical protein